MKANEKNALLMEQQEDQHWAEIVDKICDTFNDENTMHNFLCKLHRITGILSSEFIPSAMLHNHGVALILNEAVRRGILPPQDLSRDF